jgi:hypothetical protein
MSLLGQETEGPSRHWFRRALWWLARGDDPNQSLHPTIMVIALSGVVIMGATFSIIEIDIASQQARINERLADPIRYYEIQRQYQEQREREAAERRRNDEEQMRRWREMCRGRKIPECETLTSQ